MSQVQHRSAATISFADRLADSVRQHRTPVCVGLDPRAEQLPPDLIPARAAPEQVAQAYGVFCRGVIDAVADLVGVVKPQSAFFEQLGPPGMTALGEVISHARKAGLLVILDGKRNDIGSTAEAYAEAYLGEQSPWGADALTVSPYLGPDSLKPFVEVATARGAGVFVLVKTSNPGGAMLQDLVADGLRVYRHVGRLVERLATETTGDCAYGAVGAVVGATYPNQLAELRAAMPHAWFLVPGYGVQGGTAADVAGAFDAGGMGALVNSSRGILYAFREPDYAERFGPSRWQEAAEAATRQMIADLAEQTPAGELA